MVCIKVNLSKCQNAIECRKCINVCSGGVFTTYALGAPYDPNTKWKVNPTLVSLCSLCKKCVQACPLGAITVTT